MNYEIAILDVSFISSLHVLDKSCKTLLPKILANQTANGRCAVIESEYRNPGQPCSRVDHPCQTDKELITTKRVKEIMRSAQVTTKLKRIWSHDDGSRLHNDKVILAIALAVERPLVLACDAKLLQACGSLGIAHLCAKASLLRLSEDVGGTGIFDCRDYQTRKMLNSSYGNPFLDFGDDKHCRKCKSNTCDFRDRRHHYRRLVQ